jgi:hypothetical protein
MLQNKAMLSCLSISRWSARKTDKKVTREVTDAHNAANDAGDFRKTLVDKTYLKALTTSASAMRAYHYKMTLPWDDDGARVLPSRSYQDYTHTLKAMRQADEKLVNDFVALYPQLMAEAPRRLGSMHDPKDFPPPEEIGSKFGLKISLKPIPSADDFRVDVGDEATALIREQIKAENEEKFHAAMQDCYLRVQKVVGHIASTLRQEDPRIFDTLVTNARDLVDCLPALNLTEDPMLEQLRIDILAMLPKNADVLRNSDLARVRVADEADAILAKMQKMR